MNTTYNYDSLSRLLSVLHQAGTTTLDGATYTLDPAGNRTAKQNLLNGITENYTYDLLYQLTQATQNGNTTESYTYDAVGNRLSSLTVPSLTYNTSNELVSTSRSSYTYDYNGNLISKSGSNGATSYAWDYENRLTSITLPGSGGTVTFKYDPFGRRIQKSGPAGTTNFLYDGANIVADLDVSGTVLARYAQGSGIDEPLASVTGLGAAFFEADGLGSITSLSGASGVTDTYTYKPFGITTANGSNPNRFRFTGREWDQETGLYYYRARYYEPALGRFNSEDPMRFNVDADFYSYVGNASTNFRDPSGLCRIVVRFTKVWGIFNSHAYIVATDASGSMGFRGGPGEDGNIATMYGPYDKFFPDYETTPAACKTVLDNNEPCIRYNVAIETVLDQIEQDKIPYYFWSTNSNAVVTQALQAIGVPVPKPPISAPGWGTPLGPFVGNSPIGPALGGGGGGGIPK